MYSLMYNYPPQQKKYKKNTSNRERTKIGHYIQKEHL